MLLKTLSVTDFPQPAAYWQRSTTVLLQPFPADVAQNPEDVTTETAIIQELTATQAAGSGEIHLPGVEMEPVDQHGDSGV